MNIETISSSTIYNGRVFDVTLDTIRENGSEYTREIVRHKGSAVVIPVFDDGSTALVSQYRPAVGKVMLELPAGGLEPDEDPADAALRELEEEIGIRAATVEKLADFYVSPGFLDERMFLFIARDFTDTSQNLDDDEYIEIVRIPLREALAMALDGRIDDAKTIVGLMLINSRFPDLFSA